MIVWSSFYSVMVVLIYVLAPRWEVIALATLLAGFGVFQFPARSALIADSLSPEDRGKGISWMNTISSTLMIFAPFIAGYGYRTIWVEFRGTNALWCHVVAVFMFSNDPDRISKRKILPADIQIENQGSSRSHQRCLYRPSRHCQAFPPIS